jgi:predicted CopG family antitoxin
MKTDKKTYSDTIHRLLKHKDFNCDYGLFLLENSDINLSKDLIEAFVDYILKNGNKDNIKRLNNIPNINSNDLLK